MAVHLGAEVAEADEKMLEVAFYEPAALRELTTARGYRLVVGRRGSGKSAIFRELRKARSIEHRHEDHTFAAMLELLEKDFEVTKYSTAKMVLRVAWRIQILLECARQLTTNQRHQTKQSVIELKALLLEIDKGAASEGLAGVLALLRGLQAEHDTVRATEAPEQLVQLFNEKRLVATLNNALDATSSDLLLTFDGLDEGWVGTPTATGVVGGLVRACADLSERTTRLRNIVFLRDSMLRSLAYADDDYARDIEGNTLRLDWSWEALFKLLAARLRIVLGMKDETSNAKLWNRLVDGSLQGQDGFRRCLKRTLLRPRDLIQLLNDASRSAARHERTRILEEDIVSADLKWSIARLDDLIKEYSDIFPGIRELTAFFQSAADVLTYEHALGLLQQFIETAPTRASGLASILADSRTAFETLYSVGFIGIVRGNAVTFRYDGSQSRALQISPTDRVVVHACYWSALRIERTERSEGLELDDTYDAARTPAAKSEAIDVRVRMLGERADELTQIQVGGESGPRLDKWALSACRAVLAGVIMPIELRKHAKNPNATRVVGEIAVTNGVFQRIRNQTGAQQLVFQCYNFEEFDTHGVELAEGSAQGAKCGSLVLGIRRAPYDEPTHSERLLIAKQNSSGVRLMILPAQIFQGALNRMRKSDADGRRWFTTSFERALNRHEKYWKNK